MEKFKKDNSIMDSSNSEWDEEKHPRDDEGKFMSCGLSSAASKNSVVKIDLNTDIHKKLTASKDINTKRKIVLDYILNNLRGKYPTSDGRIVAVERLGAKKLVMGNELKIKVLPELANLIMASRFKNIIDVKHRHFKQMAYYDVSFEVENITYEGILNIGIRENKEATLYDLNPFNAK